MDTTDEKRASGTYNATEVPKADDAGAEKLLGEEAPEEKQTTDKELEGGLAVPRPPYLNSPSRRTFGQSTHSLALSLHGTDARDFHASAQSLPLHNSTNPSDKELNGMRKETGIAEDSEPSSSDAGGPEDGGFIAPSPPRPGMVSRRTTATGSAISRQLPPLKKKETKLAQKEAHPWEHLGITLGLPMILLFDVIVPCIIYYTWYNKHKTQWDIDCREQYPGQPCPIEKPEFDKDILGSAIASFGVGELWILLARVWRLFFRREECAPLLSRNRWELDATSWVYGVAMIVALVPFVIGSSLVIPKLYLYGPSFLMGFLGVLMVITTTHPFNIPIGINSHGRGTSLRPFIYYAAEDFIAVDGLQDREFRVRYNERYESNKMFRRFFLYLTLWWILGVCVYIGCVSAVIWTLEFHIAFGLSLGVLFSYIAVWASVTFVWTKIEMKREHEAYERDMIEA